MELVYIRVSTLFFSTQFQKDSEILKKKKFYSCMSCFLSEDIKFPWNS